MTTNTTMTTSTRLQQQTRTLPKRRRRHVTHLFWAADAGPAREMGVQVRYLCGSAWGWPGEEDEPVMPKPWAHLNKGERPVYCRNCLRVMHARYEQLGYEGGDR